MQMRKKKSLRLNQETENENYKRGLQYHYGMSGLRQDFDKALIYYQIAASENHEKAIEKISQITIPKKTIWFFLGIVIFSFAFGTWTNEIWSIFFFPGLTFAVYSTLNFNVYWYKPGWAYKLNKVLFFISYLFLIPISAIVPYIYGISWLPITLLLVLGIFIIGAGIIQWLDEKNLLNGLILASGLVVLSLSIIGLSINTASQKYILREISGGVEIVGYRASDTIITIPSQLNNQTVLRIADFAFRGTNLEEITLPQTIERIGDYAFSFTPNLRTINLPHNSELGKGVFMYASALERIELPETLEIIPEEFLLGTFSLKHLTLPDSVHTINKRAIAYSAITSIVLNDSLTTLGDEAFRGTPISHIDLPDSLIHLGDYVLADNRALTSITFPTTLEIIPKGLFYGTLNLTTLTVPNHIKGIGEAAFMNAIGLVSIDLHDDITEIGSEAFRNTTSLIEVKIPLSVEQISNRTFEGATALENVILPSTLKTIQDNAFKGTTSLTSIILPNGLTSIGSSAFADMKNLKEINLPQSLLSLGSAVFSKNSSLERLEIPSRIKIIRSNFCFQCLSLNEIFLPDSIETIESYAFYQTELKSIQLPDSLLVIEDYAFFGNKNNTEILFNEVLKEIGNFAFYGHYALTELSLPDGLQRIENGAFGLCTSTVFIRIPSTIKYVGYFAFYQCDQATIYMDSNLDISTWNVAWNPTGLTIKDSSEFSD